MTASPTPDPAWPTDAWAPAGWPEASQREVQAVVDVAFDDPATVEALGPTSAFAIAHDGHLALERYAEGCATTTTLPSWSIAKSMLHAVAGVMAGDGLITLDDVVQHPLWSEPGAPPRAPITIDHAFAMRDGLAWEENYTAEGVSDVQEMLWGRGRTDVARYVAQRPVTHPPGAVYRYSSGTTNLVSAHLGQVLRTHGQDMTSYLAERLLAPLGMASATPKFDAAGTWIASSYCFATAPDFLRLGLLYLRDGCWAGGRLLPAGWVAHAVTPQPGVLDEGWGYGRHWWTLPERPGVFFANGFAGQFVLVVPVHDLVVVRLGASPTGASPLVEQHLGAVVDAAASVIATGRG